MERKLAIIEEIKNLQPIKDADNIEVATIRGWRVVVKKGEFKVGDLCVYCEIDSIMPDRPEFEFLKPRGFRIKTIKLRGQVSQGIIFPINILESVGTIEPWPSFKLGVPPLLIHNKVDGEVKIERDEEGKPKSMNFTKIVEGEDVTEVLGVIKYIPQIPACLSGVALGGFPSHSIKSDEERCIHKDTLIKTNKGKIKISEIIKNLKEYLIFSFNHKTEKIELNKILNYSILRNNNDWYKINLEDGSFIILTSNHKVFLPEIEAYREVKDLNKNDKILKIIEDI